MVAGVNGTSSYKNDLGVLNHSRLTQHLEDLLLPDFVMGGGLLPALTSECLVSANQLSICMVNSLICFTY